MPNDLRMRTPAELAAGLRDLADQARRIVSDSPEAGLIDEAATYIEGATDSLREHMAALRAALDAGRPLHNAAVAAVGSLKASDYKRGALAIACMDWRRAIQKGDEYG